MGIRLARVTVAANVLRAIWVVRRLEIRHRTATSFRYSFIFWTDGTGKHGPLGFIGFQPLYGKYKVT
ncbi:hypothetical protein [uncultured Bacteroides sp.]|uniref:hypothetical protein n=1 Tax=uncultured Bacteroides sp. TaxID=162156 RepID=UPI0026088AD7|nr:hypothetical protein [uncultured Bacteroides sp.]